MAQLIKGCSPSRVTCAIGESRTPEEVLRGIYVHSILPPLTPSIKDDCITVLPRKQVQGQALLNIELKK